VFYAALLDPRPAAEEVILPAGTLFEVFNLENDESFFGRKN
jgi:hypothetical protein